MTHDDHTVLIVDDDPAVIQVVEMLLRQAHYDVRTAESGARALELVESGGIDLVLSDVRMPGMDGVELLRKLTQGWPDVHVVMITAHGTVKDAVEAMKLGAEEFMLKPFERDEILFVVDKVLRKQEDERPPDPRPRISDYFIGESIVMQEVFEMIDRAAQSQATVLVRGETGTGKELIARAIHEKSRRADGPMIKVHCAALPDSLLESELFGYEKGAFTGATTRKPGRIELADGGTLFLDEIGDVSAATQIKLLRVLQDREFERVGGTQTLSVDLRFIAATHRDLETMMDAGEFRNDFFYRLNVIPIWSPPLRDRRDDIPRLARHFCSIFAEANDRDVMLSEDALDRLAAHHWPGNVRELRNVVERLVVLSDGDLLGADAVEREFARSQRRSGAPRAGGAETTSRTLEEQRRHAERQAVVEALERSRGNRSQAARLLGISRRTLYNKLAEYGLE